MSFAHAGQYGPSDAITSQGLPLPGIGFTVYLTGTTTKATLYTDRTMGTVAANPVAADSLGNLKFFAAPGIYDVLGNGTSLTVTVGADPADLPSRFSSVVASGDHTAKPWDAVICTDASGQTITLPPNPTIGDQVLVIRGGTNPDVEIQISASAGDSMSGGTALMRAGVSSGPSYTQSAIFTFLGPLMPAEVANPAWVASSTVNTDLGYGNYQELISTIGSFFFGFTALEGYVKVGIGSYAANHTTNAGDFIVKCTATLTLTLDNSFDGNDGIVLIVKNTGVGTVTFAAASGLTLGSDVPATLAAGKGIQLVLMGTVWHTLTAAG